jgi:hypothetical protein
MHLLFNPSFLAMFGRKVTSVLLHLLHDFIQLVCYERKDLTKTVVLLNLSCWRDRRREKEEEPKQVLVSVPKQLETKQERKKDTKMTTMNLNVTAAQVARGAHSEGAGRPQANARVYLSLVGCERLMREGATEKQIRRQAFALLRSQLGLSNKTVIARHEHGYFMVKSREVLTDLAVTVRPAA